MDHPELQADVVIVGAGPAGLACALRLARRLDQLGLSKENVFVLEKARALGAHQLSGAVMDLRGLADLEPSLSEDGVCDGESLDGLEAIPVAAESLMVLTERRSLRSPLLPRALHNAGNVIVSVHELTRWLGKKVADAGIQIFTSFAGRQLLLDGSRVLGVRTGDQGVGRDGRPKSNFQPGYDLRSPIVVLAEGPRGSLTRDLCRQLGLHGVNPQVYSLGVKELWELPRGRFPTGAVFHTVGWPLAPRLYGGGWIYGLDDHRVSIGLMTALEYRDPATDPHQLFQRFKTHPWMRQLLDGGELIRYGAKTTPMGGWYSLPPLAGDGWLLVGDSAGFVNSQRLKGLHLAIKSGILAADTVADAIAGQAHLRDYAQRVEASWIRDELWPVRNFHQGFAHGMTRGLVHAAAQQCTRGRGWRDPLPLRSARRQLAKLNAISTSPPPAAPADGRLTCNKLTDAFHSAIRHDDDQPSHLLIGSMDICNDRCRREYGNPCVSYCPAQVYEMHPTESGEPRLQVNAANCIHCKTCDIMDPYRNITWVPPEGGSGPDFNGM